MTLECDPGTFDAEKLAKFVEAGVTRVSLGVQSFDDAALEAAGRAHRREDALSAVAAVRAADLKHGWSLDLISGLPGQDRSDWKKTLEEAAALRPDHVSSYDLQVEAGTAFGRWYGDGDEAPRKRPRLPRDEDAAAMYRDASQFWRDLGYTHYEISSYALPGREARHNGRYWLPAPSWRALGLGATCSDRGRRFARPRSLPAYEAWVDAGAVVARDEAPDNPLLDETLTALRTSAGLDLGRISRVYGAGRADAVRRGAAEAVGLGLAAFDGDRLRLTDPEGFLFSNYALSGIFAELDE